MEYEQDEYRIGTWNMEYEQEDVSGRWTKTHMEQ